MDPHTWRGFKRDGDVPLRDVVSWWPWQLPGLWLDSMVLKVFSNLNKSLILWKKMRQNDLSKWMCLTVRLPRVSRGDFCIVPECQLSTPDWCAEDAGTVTHQLLYGHCFQCQEAAVTWAYFKCMNSMSLLLKIVPGSESQPSLWLMSRGHHQVSPIAFWLHFGVLVGDLSGV